MRKVIMTIATAIALAFAPMAMAGNNTTATEQVAPQKQPLTSLTASKLN